VRRGKRVILCHSGRIAADWNDREANLVFGNRKSDRGPLSVIVIVTLAIIRINT